MVKRSILFWSVVSAGVVLVVWVAFCLLVIGVPTSLAQGSVEHWSLAARLLGHGPHAELGPLLEWPVNALWRRAPWCRVPHYDSSWKDDLASVQMRVVNLTPVQPPGPMAHGVAIGPPWAGSLTVLDAGEVLRYVVFRPGAHFATLALLVALVVGSLVRLLVEVILPAEGSKPDRVTEA